MSSAIEINGDRLWNRLMEMARIGATKKGGVCRVAASDEDKRGRDLFIKWCDAASLAIKIDQIGNIFARRDGRDPDAPPVMAGSHLDSQPTGGKFDGAYGVLAALEAVDSLNDHNIETEVPVEIVSWTNEEGARFPPGLLGSGVYTGFHTLEYGLSQVDKDGLTMGAELERIGYRGEAPAKPWPIQAAFEIHIEQGPILERENNKIGIVTDVQGLYWNRIRIEGKEAHAGSTPMNVRRDPVRASLKFFEEIYKLAEQTPKLVVTFGEIHSPPYSINTVPGELILTLDMRHPENEILDAMNEEMKRIAAEVALATSQSFQVEQVAHAPAVQFAQTCIESVRKATEITGIPAMEIVSGAGHDAMHLARIAPTSMIFIPCEDGLSHNELENATREDCIAGANVLLHAVLDQAGIAKDD